MVAKKANITIISKRKNILASTKKKKKKTTKGWDNLLYRITMKCSPFGERSQENSLWGNTGTHHRDLSGAAFQPQRFGGTGQWAWSGSWYGLGDNLCQNCHSSLMPLLTAQLVAHLPSWVEVLVTPYLLYQWSPSHHTIRIIWAGALQVAGSQVPPLGIWSCCSSMGPCGHSNLGTSDL